MWNLINITPKVCNPNIYNWNKRWREQTHSACHRDFFFRLKCQQVNAYFFLSFFFFKEILTWELKQRTKQYLVLRDFYLSVQVSHSVVSDSATSWTATPQGSLSITSSQSLLKLMSIESVMPSNHIFNHPLLLPPLICPSIRVFSTESVLCIRWPKYWSFSFSISPFNEYSGLISLRIIWFDFLAVQGTLKSFPTPQFKLIGSLVLRFLYNPILAFIHDHWKNQNFD